MSGWWLTVQQFMAGVMFPLILETLFIPIPYIVYVIRRALRNRRSLQEAKAFNEWARSKEMAATKKRPDTDPTEPHREGEDVEYDGDMTVDFNVTEGVDYYDEESHGLGLTTMGDDMNDVDAPPPLDF